MKSPIASIFSITLLLSSFCYSAQQERPWRKPTKAEIETIQTAVAANDARKLHELGEQGILCNINDPEGAPLLIANHLNIDTVAALVANGTSLLKKHHGNTLLEHITYNALAAEEKQFHARKRIFDLVVTFHGRTASQHPDLKKLQQFINRSKKGSTTRKDFLIDAIQQTITPQTSMQSPNIIHKQSKTEQPTVIMTQSTVISDIETATLERIPTPVIPKIVVKEKIETGRKDFEGFIILENTEKNPQALDEEFEVIKEVPEAPASSSWWWPFW